MSHCPLCHHPEPAHYHRDRLRDYLCCPDCQLVFVPPLQHLTAEQEKGYYDLHQNSADDQGYRDFLSRLFTPVNKAIAANSMGLDFGCGPGPTLSRMFEEAGHRIELYDPYYYPQQETLDRHYDFIVSSEVVEHLRTPDTVFQQLLAALKPGGLLGIMTKRVIDRDAFSRWHYKNDPTHISFFSDATFHWLAQRYNLQLTLPGKDVALLTKSNHD